jgi:hypothetical protein
MLMPAYIAYFEQIAATHALIQHNPDSSTTDTGSGQRRFATYNADDVLAKTLRTKIGFPALLAELYEFDFTQPAVYDPKPVYRAAFSIVCQASARDLRTEIQALATAEQIMWDVVQKLYADHYQPGTEHCSTPFAHINLTPASAMAFGPVWDYSFGWRFEFSFRPKMQRNLTDAPAVGTFI